MMTDRTYCREHCKGFRETGGLCFADGACEKYTQYMREQKVGAKSSPEGAQDGASSLVRYTEVAFWPATPKDESLPEGHC